MQISNLVRTTRFWNSLHEVHIKSVNKRQRIPKGQSKMGTQYEETTTQHNQYVSTTTVRKQTQRA